jgi:hypothetical protein
VSFSATPKSGLANGTAIKESAQVLFDDNPPINTPTTTQTIDASTPKVTATATPAKSGSTVALNWKSSGQVPLGFSQPLVAVDGLSLGSVGQTTGTSYTFHALAGHTYGFGVQSTDLAGVTSAVARAGTGALLVGCKNMFSKLQICNSLGSKKWGAGLMLPGQSTKKIAIGVQGSKKHADNLVIRDQACPPGAPKKAICFAFTDYNTKTGWQYATLGEPLFFTSHKSVYLYNSSTKYSKLRSSSEAHPLTMSSHVYMWVP